jgi:hypothetical protein
MPAQCQEDRMRPEPRYFRSGHDEPKPEFVAGLDVGQVADYSAIAIIEHAGRAPDRPRLVRHLARFPLGTQYPDVVGGTLDLLDRPPLAGTVTLAVDQSGVGRAVVDLLHDEVKRRRWSERAPPLVPITITAGHETTRVAGGWGVPKQDLVDALAVPLEAGWLKIAPELEAAAILVREMDEFRRSVSTAGRVSYGVESEWRVGANDDVLLAVAIACWVAGRVPVASMSWI